jgi:hypothetical protein
VLRFDDVHDAAGQVRPHWRRPLKGVVFTEGRHRLAVTVTVTRM